MKKLNRFLPFQKPSTVIFITNGEFEVVKLLHYDLFTNMVYYISNERNPGTRHVYRVVAQEYAARECITCPSRIDPVKGFVEELGTHFQIKKTVFADGLEGMTLSGEKNCSYFDAAFGLSSNWFSVTCLGMFFCAPNNPNPLIHSTITVPCTTHNPNFERSARIVKKWT